MPAKRVQLDEADSVAVGIVRAVASVLDMPVQQLPPLEETVNTDLLELLADGSHPAIVEGQLTFDYAGLIISVNSDRELEIR